MTPTSFIIRLITWLPHYVRGRLEQSQVWPVSVWNTNSRTPAVQYGPAPPGEQTKIIALLICIQALPPQTEVCYICTNKTSLLHSQDKSGNQNVIFTTVCEIFVPADCLCIQIAGMDDVKPTPPCQTGEEGWTDEWMSHDCAVTDTEDAEKGK